MIETLESFEKHCEIATGSHVKENASRYREPWKDFQNLFRHLYLFRVVIGDATERNMSLNILAGKP